jgi:hypothetical protein
MGGRTSPSNFLAFNPEALSKAVETQGASIATGMKQLLEDLGKGHVSQTDETVFEVGRNVATTEGAVVYENELFQLIEYKPLTAKVHERPMLFVPPCINKYYILDLQPENSVIRYTVEQGHRVFVVSWRNPDDSLKSKTWDDYIEHGPIQAIEVVQARSAAPTRSTPWASASAARSCPPHWPCWRRAATSRRSRVTLLTTLLDFADTGILDIFVDEASVQLREMTIGEQAPTGPGLLKGQELATTFSFLRPNDLVWNYVVGNYLKGEAPPPFDLLYWNGDSTNLPGPMYCWYLRHTYLRTSSSNPASSPSAARRSTSAPSRRRCSSTAAARTTSCPGRRPTRPRRCSRADPVRARRQRPHRRRHQPAGQGQAQPLDQPQAAGQRRRLVRRRHRTPGQLVDRLVRLAEAAGRQAGARAQSVWQPCPQGHRACARAATSRPRPEFRKETLHDRHRHRRGRPHRRRQVRRHARQDPGHRPWRRRAA